MLKLLDRFYLLMFIVWFVFCVLFVFVCRQFRAMTSQLRAIRWRAESRRGSLTPQSRALWSTQAPKPRASASTCRFPNGPSLTTSPCESINTDTHMHTNTWNAWVTGGCFSGMSTGSHSSAQWRRRQWHETFTLNQELVGKQPASSGTAFPSIHSYGNTGSLLYWLYILKCANIHSVYIVYLYCSFN